MSQSSQLTRTCSSCGLKKPLSAFLQLNTQGTSYGSICSDCRRTITPPSTDSDSSSSGFQIDARAKIAIEQEQKRQMKIAKEQNIKEAKKKDQSKADIVEEIEQKELQEKSHREFIKTQKNRFLAITTSTTGKTVIPPSKEASLVTLSNDKTKQQEMLIKQEKILTTADMTVPFLVALFHEVRFQNQVFQHFLNSIGERSPIARFSILRALEQAYQKNTSLRLFLENNMKQQPKQPEKKSSAQHDPLIDYIENHWKPSGSKRR